MRVGEIGIEFGYLSLPLPLSPSTSSSSSPPSLSLFLSLSFSLSQVHIMFSNKFISEARDESKSAEALL